MKNPTPVLLDRLAHALERRGVKATRAKLLEGAAAAFGFHNSNELTAAAKRGDIVIPAVVPIGRMSLPDGRTLLVVTDPTAGSAYAIDESFVDQAVCDERREQIGVTPYGHLVRLDELPDATFIDIRFTPSPDAFEPSHVRDAQIALDSYTAADHDSDAVGQAENLLSMVEHHVLSGAPSLARAALLQVRALVEDLPDDADRNLGAAIDAVALAQADLTFARTDDMDAGLAAHLRAALAQIDDEIENRKAGGDASAWAEMQTVSDAGHEALREAGSLPAAAPAAAGRVTVSLVTAMLELRHGSAVPFIGADEDDLYRQVAAWCRQNDTTGKGFGGLDDRETVSAYFEDNERDGLTIADAQRFSLPIAAAPAAANHDGVCMIRLATVTHRHGVDNFAGYDEDEVVGRLAAYCISSWDEVGGLNGLPRETNGLTDQQIVDGYFEHHPTETYEMSDIEIGSNDGRLKSCARCDTALKPNGLCGDETCPFSDVPQSDPNGWSGHPSVQAQAPAATAPGSAMIHVATASYDGGVEAFADVSEDALYGKVAAWCMQFKDELVGVPEDFEDLPPSRQVEIYDDLHSNDRIDFSTHPVAIDIPVPFVQPRARSSGETPLAREGRIDAAVTWITDAEGEDTGQVTISDLASRSLPFYCDEGDGSTGCLTEREMEHLGAGEKIDAGGLKGVEVQLGFSVLWQDRKWLAPEVEFPWDEAQDDLHDPEGQALRSANEYVETIRKEVEAFGGQIHLFEGATDFAHEVSILLPFDLAFQAADPEAWKTALGIMLAPSWTRDRSTPTLRARFDPQAWINDWAPSVDIDGRPNEWDAAFEMALSGRKWGEQLINGIADADSLHESPLAPQWVRDWNGPFDVRFDDEQLEAFVAAL